MMALVQAMMLYCVGRLMAITAGAMGEDTFYRLIKLATILCIICVIAEPLHELIVAITTHPWVEFLLERGVENAN